VNITAIHQHGGHIHQVLHIRALGRSLGTHQAGVGVTHEHSFLTPLVESPPQHRGIVAEPGQGKIDGDNVMAATNEILLGPTPTPRPVREAVNQHQRVHSCAA
jgi:hypothetical protein